jgi:quercetin dioxygenase-like cupin family protein
VSASPDPLDALIAAPDTHSLLLENENVRVVATRIAPGETTSLHTHCWPQLMIVESFSDFIRRDESGQVIVDSRGGPLPPPGAAVWVEALAPHTLENVGDADIRVIGVEVKKTA